MPARHGCIAAWVCLTLQAQGALPPAASEHAIHHAEAKVIPSPDGRKRVRVRNGAVYLEGKGMRVRRLARITRSGSLIWSPGSDFFALNDDMGSNCANAYLFDGRTGRLRADLEQALNGAFPEDLWTGHRYVRVRSWSGPRTVEILVDGHADSWRTEFDIRYRFEVGKGPSRLSRQRRGPGDSVLIAFTEPCPKG